MFQNKVKELLAAGQAAWGSGLSDASEVLAQATLETGIDFLWIDLEHRPYEVEAVRWIPILCRRKSCVPLIRVAGLDSQLIKKALDIGASAIMVPQINSAEDAERAVQYSKYPPEGTRGVSPLWTLFEGVSWDDYLPAANPETLVIVQIETLPGIENLEAIAAVPGVDVLFVGPTDTSAVLGHIGQIQHPEVQNFLTEFPRRVAPSGKASGITVQSLEECKRVYEQGYRFISCGNLVLSGKAALSSDLSQLRAMEGANRRVDPPTIEESSTGPPSTIESPGSQEK